jgi:hypothetical protein
MIHAAIRLLASVAAGASLVALSACGGSGGSNNAPAANATPAGNAAPPVAAATPSGPRNGLGPMTGAGARYCGPIHNSTTNQDDQAEIDVDAGDGFNGNVTVLGQTLSGAGRFQGTMASGQCSGVAASSGLAFTGACPSGGEYDGTYTINGQNGTLRMSSGNCH